MMRDHITSKSFMVGIFLLIVMTSPSVHGWTASKIPTKRHSSRTSNHYSIITSSSSYSSSSKSTSFSLNLFEGIGDMLTGGKLIPQTKLPYGNSLIVDDDDNDNQKRIFAIQEKLISWTGEDFDVYEIDQNNNNNHTPYVQVRGALLHLPGKDKMRIVQNGTIIATLDRKLIALKPTYDIYRGDCIEKIGWIEKAIVSLTDTFDFYAECEKGGIGPFAAKPAYKLSGDFLERNFGMKNGEGETVAKVIQDRLIEFDNFDHYQLQVAQGMDPALVVACACAIDEELEEEHEKKRQERAANK